MVNVPRWSIVLTLAAFAGSVLRGNTTEAIVILVGDLHSAYDKTAQFVAHVDRLKQRHPGVPFAVLINGDSFEYGNAVARRSGGTIDFAMFAALVQRAPTVLNLGNHEPDFFDPVMTVAKLRDAGVTVISGNARDRTTGKPLAPAATVIKLGRHEATIVGFMTDRLGTFRVAVRPDLDLSSPLVWARANLGGLLERDRVSIVLSHSGLRVDRELLPLVPEGTFFAGAHDHLRFVHRAGRTVYVHSGSWTEYIAVAHLRAASDGWQWDIQHVAIRPDDPADPAVAELIARTMADHLTQEERAVVGHSARAMNAAEAGRFAAAAARAATKADIAIIGATTFGGGLPAGEISRHVFDGCVRFDGPLFAGTIDGASLRDLLRRCNQDVDTPFADRAGENLVAAAPEAIDDRTTYRLVTTDWIARNASQYLGPAAPALTEVDGVRLKQAVLSALR